MTTAMFGFGTFLKLRTSTGPDVYTIVGEQTGIKPPKIKVDTVDASHEQSPSGWREFLAGLVDGGEASFDIQYLPASSAEALILSRLRTLCVWSVVYPDGSHADFSGIITGFEPDAPMDDKLTATVTIKISGIVTMVAAAAPTNAILPSMSGAITQGTTITAFDGVWNNQPTSFTYQWKKSGTNIGGATNKTYVPVVGDVGAPLSVAVTATNSAGSATATSANSVNVV